MELDVNARMRKHLSNALVTQANPQSEIQEVHSQQHLDNS